jgi:hypothetical protein
MAEIEINRGAETKAGEGAHQDVHVGHATDLAYRIHQLRSKILGASALVRTVDDHEASDELLAVIYLLDEAADQANAIAEAIDDSTFKFRAATSAH